ncbi:MAG: NAD-dependent epimerase/dehydratase family protein [Streptosporangiaceae bacterium]
MRVLVTGGAGFIGSHLVDALVARGDEVAIVDDMSAGRPDRVSAQAAVHKLTVTEAGALTAVTAEFGPEIICHLAARIDVRASVANPVDDAQINVIGTVNVLEAARAVGARVLFGSTGAVIYGRDAPIPSLEDVLPLPESPYGVAKNCAEQYVQLYNRLHGTRHAVLRFANVYGPRQDPVGQVGVVAIFCARALAAQRPVVYGDGLQTRDFVYVGDAVNAYLAAADRGRPGTWNIGTGVEVSILELAGIIGAVAGHPVDPVFAAPRPGELRRGALASERARRDLGWVPTISLADGVNRVYRWIEAGAPERAAW